MGRVNFVGRGQCAPPHRSDTVSWATYPHTAAMIFTRLGARGCLRRVTFFTERKSPKNGCEECFALRRDPLLPSAAKVGKNAVQTCGLKIRSRPVRRAVREVSHAGGAGQKLPEMWHWPASIPAAAGGAKCRGVPGSTVFKRLSNRALAVNSGKCRCGPLGRADLAELRSGAFQSKSGSAQRNTSIPHFGRIGTHWPAAKGNPKTMGFWRRSFPHFFCC